jgi:acetyl esterase
MKFKKLVLPFAILSLGLSFLAHGKLSQLAKAQHTPPEPDPDMQAVLDALAALNAKPIPNLSPEEARLQPTPKDAVLRLLESQGQPLNPEPVASIQHLNIPGPSGEITLNVYTPTGHGPFPVIVYFHGGGFVIADSKVYESSIRALANGAEAVVVSVDYHRAPEYKFPSQPNEAYAAFKWVVENAAQINGDPQRVAVAGESAGGNLAAVVSLMARDHKETSPVHQLLIYPVVDDEMLNESYLRNEQARPLNPMMMKWFFNHYVKQLSDANNPYALPNKASSLQGLPPTTIITAEIDPLYSEGKAFAERLQAEGVQVNYQHYDGVAHEFFGMGAVLPKAKDAQAFASDALKKSFQPT